MLEFQDLTKIFSKKAGPAISSVDFDVRDGETIGFVGLNGAGKTTTIRLAAGVALPTRGSISIDGKDIVKEKIDASREVGWVPEFPNFDMSSRAKSLMLYYAGFFGIPKSDAERRTKELLDEVKLTGFENRPLRTYSQGMKKRFSLAASMLADPRNYLFDEILNGLDPEGIHFMRELVSSLKKQRKAILLSSHLLSEVDTLSDRVVFIHKGKIMKIASRDELSGYGAQGSRILRLVVEGLEDSGRDYLEKLGDKVEIFQEEQDPGTPGRIIVSIRGFRGESYSVNADLVRMGTKVHELNYQRTSLEDYFFELVSEQQDTVKKGTP